METEELAYSGHVGSLSGEGGASKMAAAEQGGTGVQLCLAALDVVIGGGLQVGPLKGLNGIEVHPAAHIQGIEPAQWYPHDRVIESTLSWGTVSIHII